MTIYHKPTRLRLTWPLGYKCEYRLWRDNLTTLILERDDQDYGVAYLELYVADGRWYHAGWPVEVEVVQ